MIVGLDPLYWVMLLPALGLAGYASYLTNATFKKYREYGASSQMTGAQAAQRLLQDAGIRDVSIEEVGGFLSDHYDPSAKALRLSPDVYNSQSLSAIGVACHEAGHALQHAEGYQWLQMRSSLVPVVGFASNASYFVLLAGMFMGFPSLMAVGILLFSASVLFSLVTLPVEWDASARAKKLMVQAGIVSDREAVAAGKVLNAAFLTYVASAVSSLLTLVYYLIRSGFLGGDD